MTYDVVTDTAGMCLQVVLAPQLAPVPTAALRISALLVGGLRWRLGRRCTGTLRAFVYSGRSKCLLGFLITVANAVVDL